MEYEQQYVDDYESCSRIANRWAREGWRLHSVTPGAIGILLMFEREKPYKALTGNERHG